MFTLQLKTLLHKIHTLVAVLFDLEPDKRKNSLEKMMTKDQSNSQILVWRTYFFKIILV